MSTPLAVAGVTESLRVLLENELVSGSLAAVLQPSPSVTALPPDRVVPSGGSETNQLNLFLHRVTENQGWRNERLPAVDGSGRRRLENPPLALNLHYLLSAYSATELSGEVLLGIGMQLLHEHPILTREALRAALTPPTGSTPTGLQAALNNCGLPDQVETLRIIPEVLSTEEMSKIWTATQTHFRPTAAYRVTVVLIQSDRTAASPLPVLSRGPVDTGTGLEQGVVVVPHLIPPVPMIDDVIPPGQQPVARLGETIELQGHHLNGTGQAVRLIHERLGIDETLSATGPDDASRIEFIIPTGRAGDFPVGIYQVSGRVVRPGESDPRETNSMALVLAPGFTSLPTPVVRDGQGTASFTIGFRPELWTGQTAMLVLGQQEFAPASTTPGSSLDFSIANAPVGTHLARLRIDGIDTPIIDRSTTPPTFFNQQMEIQ